MMPRRAACFRFLATVVTLGAIGGCDVTEPEGDLGELGEAMARWAAVGPDSYQYAVAQLCFCGFVGPVRVTVVNGVVTNRVVVETGEPLEEFLADGYPNVEGLFAIIADAIARDPAELEVTYDADTGVPLDFWIDYSRNIADEELGYSVSEVPGPIG